MTKQSARRRRLVRAFAPAVGLLAAGLLVWQGSYAAFNATTTDNSNAWATGSLVLQNNGGNGSSYSNATTATFGGTLLKPGSTNSQCVTVQNSGSLSGGLAMYASSISDTTTNGHALSDQITVSVVAAPTATDISANCASFPATGNVAVLTNVALSAFPSTYGTATSVATAANSKVAYKVTWTFTSAGSFAADNPLQGKTATANFTWEIQ
jgi:hypothetical protein